MNTSKLFIALLLTSSYVFAEDGKFYIGASGGQADYDSKITGLTGTSKLDEEDTAWKIYTGYRWENNFGLEIQYADFGEVSISGNNGDQFTDGKGTALVFAINNAKIYSEVKSYGIAASYSFPLHENFSLFGKAGIHRWDLETADNASGSYPDEDGTEPFGGLGAEFSYENFALRVEYERYKIDSDDIDDIDFASAGLTVSF